MTKKAQDWLGTPPELLLPRLRSLLNDIEKVAQSGDYPQPTNTVDLDDWMLMRRAVPCLAGRSTGHPDIRDGAPTITSEVYFIDSDRRLARTLSRWYSLSDPMDDLLVQSSFFQNTGV
jgi:hypothetical protein